MNFFKYVGPYNCMQIRLWKQHNLTPKRKSVYKFNDVSLIILLGALKIILKNECHKFQTNWYKYMFLFGHMDLFLSAHFAQGGKLTLN